MNSTTVIRTVSIEVKKKSVINKIEKTVKLLQHYKNIWYIIFRELQKHNQFDISMFNSVTKLIKYIRNDNYPEYVKKYVIQLKEMYSTIGADTCKSIHNTIVRELKSIFAKWKSKKKASLPVPKKLDRLYTFTLEVNPNMITDKRKLKKNTENKVVIRLCKKFGAIKVPIPPQIDKLRIKIQYRKDLPILILFSYEVQVSEINLNRNNFLSIDVGINNIVSCFTNVENVKSFCFSGNEIKTINQLVNKLHADNRLSINDKRRLWNYRNKVIKHYFNTIVSKLIDICIRYNIGTIIIPTKTTELYQQQSKLSKQSNQIIRMIPLGYLIKRIKEKCEEYNINVVSKYDESYTSRISIFETDKVEKIIGKNYNEIKNIGITVNTVRNGSLLKDRINNKQLHADINGAILIAVKHLGMNVLKSLFMSKYTNVKIFNPIIFKNIEDISVSSLLIGKKTDSLVG